MLLGLSQARVANAAKLFVSLRNVHISLSYIHNLTLVSKLDAINGRSIDPEWVHFLEFIVGKHADRYFEDLLQARQGVPHVDTIFILTLPNLQSKRVLKHVGLHGESLTSSTRNEMMAGDLHLGERGKCYFGKYVL